MESGHDNDLWDLPARSRMSYQEMNPYTDHDSLSLSQDSLGSLSLSFPGKSFDSVTQQTELRRLRPPAWP